MPTSARALPEHLRTSKSLMQILGTFKGDVSKRAMIPVQGEIIILYIIHRHYILPSSTATLSLGFSRSRPTGLSKE